jgi:hypothetical protein
VFSGQVGQASSSQPPSHLTPGMSLARDHRWAANAMCMSLNESARHCPPQAGTLGPMVETIYVDTHGQSWHCSGTDHSSDRFSHTYRIGNVLAVSWQDMSSHWRGRKRMLAPIRSLDGHLQLVRYCRQVCRRGWRCTHSRKIGHFI